MNIDKTASDTWDSGRRSTLRLLYWTVSWTLTLAVLKFGPQVIWDGQAALTAVAFVVNAGVGVGMIVANIHYLRDLDELQQRIFLNAAALTLGVGLVCAPSYELLKTVGFIAFEPEIGHVMILMGLTFVAGVFYGQWRYR